MSSVNIGTPVDLQKLIESRMLIQASSGGGKSYMLRVLAEQILKHMPVIILDWEGEFASLREKFDVVLAGPNGDAPCDVKSAALLARSLIELNVSAVVDMSELKMHQRQEYVRLFLDALVALPKKLWPSNRGKAVIVMVDEAHKLCPQKERSVASSSVVDLQSLGRKRGLAGILATQRLSKLNKDAAAECNNIMVGRCSMIDSSKACDELGWPQSARHALTQLKVGEWRAVGPAFAAGVQEFRGAKSQTTHAKTGAKLLMPPAPSAKIKKVLPDLKAVQEKTTQEIIDLAGAKKEITKLRGDVTRAKNTQRVESVEKLVADPRAIERAVRERDREWEPKLRAANNTINGMLKQVHSARDILVKAAIGTIDTSKTEAPPPSRSLEVTSSHLQSLPPARLAPDVEAGEITVPQQKILDSLAWWKNVGVDDPGKGVVAVMAGYKKSGNFDNLMGQLKAAGLIDYPGGGTATLTDQGQHAANYPDLPGDLLDLHQAWRAKLTRPQVRVLNVVMDNYPEDITKQDLADCCGYQISGNFDNIIGQLRKLGVITKRGMIEATDLLFPKALL